MPQKKDNCSLLFIIARATLQAATRREIKAVKIYLPRRRIFSALLSVRFIGAALLLACLVGPLLLIFCSTARRSAAAAFGRALA